jgi:hypothetical protein
MFTWIAYDLAGYLFSALNKIGNPDNLNRYIHLFEPWIGTATTIHFGGNQMNKSLQFFRLTQGGTLAVDDAYLQSIRPLLTVDESMEFDQNRLSETNEGNL